MTDDTRLILACALAVAAIGWWFGVETYRGFSQDHSARLFWLHLTAPVVAIGLMLVAIWLLINTERLRKHRGLAEGRRLSLVAPNLAVPIHCTYPSN